MSTTEQQIREAAIPMMPPAMAPATWAEWNAAGLWPDWVPEDWRKHIESSWSDRDRRGPRKWLQCAIYNKAYPHGMLLCATKGQGLIQGRYLYTWGNMCVLVDKDGTARVTSDIEIGWAIERGEKPVDSPTRLRVGCLTLCEKAHVALGNIIGRLKGRSGRA
jgi:hypothetical protein